MHVSNKSGRFLRVSLLLRGNFYISSIIKLCQFSQGKVDEMTLCIYKPSDGCFIDNHEIHKGWEVVPYTVTNSEGWLAAHLK